MQISIQVRYSDFDMMGHLNNSAYATYLEVARLQYLHTLFAESSCKWTDVVASLSIDYRRPVLLSARPLIHIWCSRIGNSSYELSYKVAEESDEEVIYAEGKTIQVCVDPEAQTSIKLTDCAKEALAKNLKTKE